MRILVFQHIACEHPGIFRDYFAADGIVWDAVELDEGEAIPALDGYDALLVMGGPMDVWEEERHPWLATEKAAIHDWVLERRMPFLGLCLGHQLLAAALGGEVGPADRPEIGVLEADLTEAGRASPIFRGVLHPIRCLQWHSAEVKRLPAGGVILASSAPCRVNALSYGERAFGLQFHLEATPTTVRDWGAIPAYAAALERSLGPGALERLDAEASLAMPQFGVTAHRLYENFMIICRTAASRSAGLARGP